jgi:hypothetical protein
MSSKGRKEGVKPGAGKKRPAKRPEPAVSGKGGKVATTKAAKPKAKAQAKPRGKGGGANRGAKGTRANKGKPPRISSDTYNKLWLAYNEKQVLDYCAKKAGVNRRTAERYIDGPGAPEYMMHPIAARYARVQSTAQDEEDLTLAKFRSEMLKDVILPSMKIVMSERVLLSKDAAARLEEAQKAKKGDKIKGARVGLESLTRSIDRMIRLGEKMLGGADIKVEGSGGIERKFADWTEEELLEYGTTGKVPERLRGSNGE